MRFHLTKRIKEIDFLYALGTILVVLGHSHSSDWTRISGTPYEFIINFIYTFHMPLFFFVAGYLFLNSGKLLRVGYWYWIGEKALKIFVPYFFLTIAFLIPKMHMDTGLWCDFDYTVKTFLQPRNNVWGHLWFLPVLFLCFAAFGISRFFLKNNHKIEFYIIVTVICVALFFLPIDTEWLGFTDFRSFIIFFDIGMISYEASRKSNHSLRTPIKIAMILLGLTVSALLFVFAYDYLPIKLLTAAMMLTVCYLTATMIQENKYCEWISKHNYTIYLYSWPAQAVVMMACDRINTSWVVTFLAMFVAGILFPVALIFVYEKLPKIHNRFFDLALGVK